MKDNMTIFIAFSCAIQCAVRSSYPNKNPLLAEACDGRDSDILPHVQTLKNFPAEELIGKVVMVRLDVTVLLREQKKQQSPVARVISTIKYLHKAGAKLILISSWSLRANLQLLKLEYVAGY